MITFPTETWKASYVFYKNFKILLFTKIARKISAKFKSSQITLSNLYYFEVEKMYFKYQSFF